MKRLQLVLTVLDKKGQVQQYDRVQGDNLVELLAQFQLVIAQVAEQLKTETVNEREAELRERMQIDDDIPF